MSLAELFDIFQNNVSLAMLNFLAEDLGVKVSSLQTLGVGFYPGYQAWVFAERDAKGDIVGLKYRYLDGKKGYEKGSKSGLTYPFNVESVSERNRYASGSYKWVRIADAGIRCPICDKPDWCRVSPDDLSKPSAVLCARIRKGCTKVISENNYLHILDSERNKKITGRKANVLPETDLPILIVEGATDVLTALDLDFIAIGRPSASGGLKDVKQMPLIGQQTWIIGENDAGAGKEGLDKCFIALRKTVKDLVRVMPPENIKDLRQWVQQGLTQAELISYVEQHGDGATLDPNIFETDAPYPIAERFLGTEFTVNSIPILRNYKGQWLTWQENCYTDKPETILRGSLYRYLSDKQFTRPTKDGPALMPYKATANKIRDILDALSAWCPVEGDPPLWLRDGETDPRNLIAFRNGLLDVNEYLKGNTALCKPDPMFFSMCVFPYDFQPDIKSELWELFLEDIFNGDKDVISLLQEWFGYLCVADTTLEKMMLFTGRPRSGKSTTIEVMTGMLGRGQCVSTDFQSLASQFGRAPLVGKLAATLGDAKTPRSGEADAALETILRIIGRDPIFINPKHRQGFDIYLTTRFTIAMNGLPAFTDHAKALAARTNIIAFPNSYLGREDFTLKDRLRHEAEQGKLLPWALEGLRRLRERGRFSIPSKSETVLQEMIGLTSPLTSFVDECLNLGDGATSAQMVYEAWQHWCGENGRKPGMNAQFGRNLIAECPQVSKERLQEQGRLEYVYRGLTLQAWIYNKYLGRPE